MRILFSLLVRAFITRETQISLCNLYKTIKSLFTKPKTNPMSESSTPESTILNESQPSIPISYPLKTLHHLKSQSYLTSFHFPFNTSSSPILSLKTGTRNDNDAPPSSSTPPPPPLPDRPRLLVCHDMKGGYGDDKWVQGGTRPDAYSIWHWRLIDVFVYFSHSLVTVPPCGWVNAAHLHGVRVLGTFITEWDEGMKVCDELLESVESARLYSERLAELAQRLGFDGWLINMEVKLKERQVPNLKEFVRHLAHTMHTLVPGSLVLWYDSVTIHGDLKWQDQLNAKNKPFFDLCDGIFVNYTWKRNYLKLSADLAGDRKFDVYMGIDVFGRNTFGGGQWNTNDALEVIKEDNVSAAIFAPGWVYETDQPPDFQTAQKRWWALVEKAWGRTNKYPKLLPFYSNFDKGYGYHISVNGTQVANAPWNNISCQAFQPILEFVDGPADAIQVIQDSNEESYDGGGNVTFNLTLQVGAHFTTRLFNAEILLGSSPLHISYSVKTKMGSLLGLSLQFSSIKDKKRSLIIAPWKPDQLTNKFITVTPCNSTETGTGWVVYEAIVSMNGHTLTEIDAVCYRPVPETKPGFKSGDFHNYFALLGHIALKDSRDNTLLPTFSSWIVRAPHVKWSQESDNYRTIHAHITWKLKDANRLLLPKYNIYVEKLLKQTNENSREGTIVYLGVAQVKAFYVSDLLIPSEVHCLKFIIQACGADGTCLKLEDSPYITLDVVEGQ